MSSTRLPNASGVLAVCFGLLVSATAGAQTSKRQDNDLLDQTRRMNQIAAEKVESDVRLALRDAQRLASSDSKKAIERLTKALTALEQDTALAPSRRESLLGSVTLDYWVAVQ